MSRAGAWILGAAFVLLATPISQAEPAQCAYYDTGPSYAGNGVTLNRASYSCTYASGSQTKDIILLTWTPPGGPSHNVTYWSESDTGGAGRYWCRWGAGPCTFVIVTADSTSLEARYAESNEGTSCYEQFILATDAGTLSAPLPSHGSCVDLLALSP